MIVTNKKVNEAIEKLESLTGASYELRTENSRLDLNYSAKYCLYKLVDSDGFAMPGTYGAWSGGFATQKDFINYVVRFENHQIQKAKMKTNNNEPDDYYISDEEINAYYNKQLEEIDRLIDTQNNK